jgi:ATP synthase protein I
LVKQEPGLDPLDEDARLNALDERLRRARIEEANRAGEGRDTGNDDYRQGMRVLSYLLGGIIGGAFVGYALDWLFGTFPWALIAMMTLGIVSGFRNIIRLSSKRP